MSNSTYAALAVADEQRAAVGVEVGLIERERLADPQPGAPQHDDHAAQPDALRTISGSAHHRDDLLHARRIRWIPKPFVARRNAYVKLEVVAGERRRPARSNNGMDSITSSCGRLVDATIVWGPS
jgi:hypothetical protein